MITTMAQMGDGPLTQRPTRRPPSRNRALRRSLTESERQMGRPGDRSPLAAFCRHVIVARLAVRVGTREWSRRSDESSRSLLDEIEGDWDSPRPGSRGSEPRRSRPRSMLPPRVSSSRSIRRPCPSRRWTSSTPAGAKRTRTTKKRKKRSSRSSPTSGSTPSPTPRAKKARDERIEERRQRRRAKAEAKKARRKARLDAQQAEAEGQEQESPPGAEARASFEGRTPSRPQSRCGRRTRQRDERRRTDGHGHGSAMTTARSSTSSRPSRREGKLPPSKPMTCAASRCSRGRTSGCSPSPSSSSSPPRSSQPSSRVERPTPDSRTNQASARALSAQCAQAPAFAMRRARAVRLAAVVVRLAVAAADRDDHRGAELGFRIALAGLIARSARRRDGVIAVAVGRAARLADEAAARCRRLAVLDVDRHRERAGRRAAERARVEEDDGVLADEVRAATSSTT